MTALWLSVLVLLLATLLCLVPPLLRRPPPAEAGLCGFVMDCPVC
ncbi:hypothetical protein [Achromobacter insuavis]